MEGVHPNVSPNSVCQELIEMFFVFSRSRMISTERPLLHVESS